MLGALPCTAWKWVNIVKKIPTTLRPRLAFFLFTMFFSGLVSTKFPLMFSLFDFVQPICFLG